MKILIIEDEYHAVKYLSGLIKEVISEAQILANIDSVSDAVEWFNNNAAPDLIFMDIQLADGLSFDIFKKVKVPAPVIFTTAFDQYTLQAFKTNSVDYLLKPVDGEELQQAVDKFKSIYQATTNFDSDSLLSVLENFQQKTSFRQRFLIKQGKDLFYLVLKEVAYLYSEEGLTFAMDIFNKRHLINTTLDALIPELDPNCFFRISRKQIVHIDCVRKIQPYFNNRLVLQTQPISKIEAIVSRERVRNFKEWVDR